MPKVKLFYNSQPVGEADEDDVDLTVLHLTELATLRSHEERRLAIAENVRELEAAGYSRQQAIAIRAEAHERLATIAQIDSWRP